MNVYYWLGCEFFRALLKACGGFHVINREKCIEDGGVMIASNHASYLDPPVIGCAYRGMVHFVARDTLFRGFAGWLFPKWGAIPIARDQADLKSMKIVMRTLRSGKRMAMFPEGTRTHDGSLQEAKAGLGMLIAKSEIPVQPVRILGTYEAMPRGISFPRSHPITVVIGDPIEFDPEDLKAKTREAYQAIADRVMKEIEALAPGGVPPSGCRG